MCPANTNTGFDSSMFVRSRSGANEYVAIQSFDALLDGSEITVPTETKATGCGIKRV